MQSEFKVINMKDMFEYPDLENMTPQEIRKETKKVLLDILKLLFIISLVFLVLLLFTKWFFHL